MIATTPRLMYRCLLVSMASIYQERGPEDHHGEQHRISSACRLFWVGCAAPRRADRGAANDQSSHCSS